MFTVHHLNNSRSQRVLWLLEELELPYEIRHYQRDATTNLAPSELKAVHPLGKSPVIEDDGLVIAETGAIVEHILERHGGGRLIPPAGSPLRLQHTYWLHFAEGSLMIPLLLGLYLGRLPAEAAAAVMPRVVEQTGSHLAYLEAELGERPYFLGDALTGADIMLSFPVEAARLRGALTGLPCLAAWVDRLQARPAYQRALERGGPYRFGPG